MAGTCDVPGCSRLRRRRQRLCQRCQARLPGEIRVGIVEAHHQRRVSDWIALRQRAAAFFNFVPGGPPAPRSFGERNI